MSRKRDLSYRQQELLIDQPYQHLPGELQNSTGYWNPNAWSWDCRRLEAQRVDGNAMNLDKPAQKSMQNMSNSCQVADEHDGGLCLKLGNGSSFSDEPPSKRVARYVGGSGSVSSTHPTCQVDSCMVDLSNAKDYHRRHKVCESHSKAAQALVGNQMQRFCQQCSRFHILSEFDEGKRSCRRRLAGHNRRRRKIQPDHTVPQVLPSEGNENVVSTGLDLVGLLAVITNAQGSQGNNNTNNAPVLMPNKEQLIHLISKISSFSPSADAITKLTSSNISKKTDSEASPEHQSEHQSGSSGNSSSQTTLNLLDIRPHASQVSDPDALTNPSQRSRRSGDSDKTKPADIYQPDASIPRKHTTFDFIGRERSSNICLSPAEDSISLVHENDTQVNLPLQLFFSSLEDNSSPTKVADSSKYFSSGSSNQNEDKTTPSSSPGVQLFPLKSSKEAVNHKKIPCETNAEVPAESTPFGTLPFDLFGGSNKGVGVDCFRRSPNQAGYASNGSEYSFSSSACGAQDLTRKISFKLFGKVPSHLPATLRPEIQSWLSDSPSQLEGYIRPGCLVLSIYVSMPYSSWEQLDRNLLEHVSWLLQHRNVDIWKNGRFLVQTGKQLASHNNGKLRLCKSWITPTAPELISASPLAIVVGQRTRLCLRGRNFKVGTKIHYTSNGGYITKELLDTIVHDNSLNGTGLCSCEIHIEAPSGTGRYFIEVENGFKGNNFPLIVAESSICQELRQLESELLGDPKLSESSIEEHESNVLWPKEEVLNFLNELGWLFQMKRNSSDTLEYSMQRFKFLLIFSAEKDFSVLVKKLLDTLVEEKMDGDGIPEEVSEMVSAIQLLHRAVKRRCRKMVDMLINYSICNRSPKPTKIYIFTPNTAGPGGLTPLHIAACTSGSEDVIDALTNDPLELGLSCWNSQLDANGQSPCAYATSRNNLSYNQLVARKLSDRRNNQISLTVDENGTTEPTFGYPRRSASRQSKQKASSCSQCAIMAARSSQRRMGGSHGIVARPFIISMLAIAAVCVCVCLYFRGHPYTGMDSPFTWDKLQYRTI